MTGSPHTGAAAPQAKGWECAFAPGKRHCSALPNRMSNLTSLLEHGVHLGAHEVSEKIVVGTDPGVWRTRIVQSKPQSERRAPTLRI